VGGVIWGGGVGKTFLGGGGLFVTGGGGGYYYNLWFVWVKWGVIGNLPTTTGSGVGVLWVGIVPSDPSVCVLLKLLSVGKNQTMLLPKEEGGKVRLVCYCVHFLCVNYSNFFILT